MFISLVVISILLLLLNIVAIALVKTGGKERPKPLSSNTINHF